MKESEYPLSNSKISGFAYLVFVPVGGLVPIATREDIDLPILVDIGDRATFGKKDIIQHMFLEFDFALRVRGEGEG